MDGRVSYIDGLRGIAALLVLAQHSLEVVYPWLFAQVNLGRFGIVLFFMISGFVIPFGRWDSVAQFVRSRVFRLCPALWLSVAVAVVLAGGAQPATILADLAMMARPFGIPSLNGAYWTLSYELGFYAAAMVLFALGQLRNPRVVGMLALLLLYHASYGDNRFLYYACFAGGALLRMAEEDGSARAWAVLTTVLLIAIAFQHGTGVNSPPLFNDVSRRLSTALPIILFAAAVIVRPHASAVLVWFGSISYSVYLFQGILLAPLHPLAAVSPLLFVLVGCAGTIGVAALVHRYVEQPFIAMGRQRRPVEAI